MAKTRRSQLRPDGCLMVLCCAQTDGARIAASMLEADEVENCMLVYALC